VRLRQDSLFPAEMLIVGARTITLLPCREPFSKSTSAFYFLQELPSISKNNTSISGATISSTVFKIYAALVASAGCCVKIVCHLSRTFFPNLNTAFVSSTNLLFALSSFGILYPTLNIIVFCFMF